ncbi:Gfo/Idh/MocA family oxidoreductase [Moorella naiadis]|uniref:Gfo/Idh/MocA family protein n=1 Tax=Moorella naiadis (nom. illeg.) TaxID=3093670 RepID=UPI003D9C9534
MTNLRVGIVGGGFMGKAHASIYKAERDVEVAMVATSRPESAKAFAEFAGATKWTTSFEELLASPDIDAVDICAPNHLHYPVAMRAIANRKPFLIEKPLARNIAEAQEIVTAQENAGLVAVYGENLRYSPPYVKAKEIIDEGGIGNVIMMRINEIHNGPFHSQWFWDAQKTGGGALLDMGIHGLFVAEWLVQDRACHVYAELGTLKWANKCLNGAEDTAFCTLRFPGGAIAEIVNSWAASGGIDVRTEIYGTEGTIYIDASRQAGGLKVYSERGYGDPVAVEAGQRPHVAPKIGWSFPVPDEWQIHGHAPEVRHFLACVRNEAKPLSTLRDGMRALQLVDALYRSGRSGEVATL